MQHLAEVRKENIPTLHFDSHEVLGTDFEKQQRRENLYKAMVLGNTYKKKVTIRFETDEGSKEVQTTIWAATDDSVLLKGGIHIPIRCIREVNLYRPA